MERLRGIIPPVITPFDSGGRVDSGVLDDLVDFWAERVDALFVCGTYGSGPMMSPEERKAVAAGVAKRLGGRKPLVVHVGAPSTVTAVELARHAESLGACVVAAVPPYYYEHGADAVKRYFDALVKAVSIPVYVYNNPKRTGIQVSADLLNELAGIGVKGLKDSTFDILYYMEVRRKVHRPGFDFVAGSEALILPSWIAGARAFIPGLANCLPEMVRELMQLCEAERYEEALQKQQVVLRVREILHRVPSISAVHAILDMRGIEAGLPRSPFVPVSPEVYRQIKAELEHLGVLDRVCS